VSTIIEADENGAIHLPAELLPEAKPHNRYRVETTSRQVVVSAEEVVEPLGGPVTPEEKAREFLRWARSHSEPYGLSDDAVSRDSVYD
jgi:hypothetical protein